MFGNGNNFGNFGNMNAPLSTNFAELGGLRAPSVDPQSLKLNVAKEKYSTNIRFGQAKLVADLIRQVDENIKIMEEQMSLPLDIALDKIMVSLEPDLSEIMAQLVKRLAPLCCIEIVDRADNPFGKLAKPMEHDKLSDLMETTYDEHIINLRKQLADIMNGPVEKEEDSWPEVLTESTADVVDKTEVVPVEEPVAETSDKTNTVTDDITKESTPTSDAKPTGVEIKVDGYPNPVTVMPNGDIMVNGKILDSFPDTQGYYKVDLPLEGGRHKRVTQHLLVAQAYLTEKPQPRDCVVHKNGNQKDCRASNLGWKSMTKTENPNFDGSDAINTCVALIASGFDQRKTILYLQEHKYRASVDLVKKIKNKEAFANISDRYFDEKLRIRRLPHCLEGVVDTNTLTWIPDEKPAVKKDAPKNETKETAVVVVESVDKDKTSVVSDTDRVTTIRESLRRARNSMLKAFEHTRDVYDDLTIYEVFNVKNGMKTNPPQEDVDVLIRCARNGGNDIAATIKRECGITVTDRQITKATRSKKVDIK